MEIETGKKLDKNNIEKCVICWKKIVDEKKDTNINIRTCYIEGGGSVCANCYSDIYLRLN